MSGTERIFVRLFAWRDRTKKEPPAPVILEIRNLKTGEKLEHAPQPGTHEQTISTGYPELDQVLTGGLPEGYAVLLLSPAFDERDLLLRRMIESALKSGRIAFYVSADIGRTKDLASKYENDFYVFCAHEQKLTSGPPNLYAIPSVENLVDLNIALNKAIADKHLEEKVGKVFILDILSEVLLRQKSLNARKWITDFVAKRKAQGFTTLATLNPLVASKEETESIIDFFDGILEIYEKEMRERSRRFLVVKKMYARRYSENELMLDKDKLF